MSMITGFQIQQGGRDVGEVFLDEGDALAELKNYREYFPEDSFHLSRINVRLPAGESVSRFGYTHAYGAWQLERSVGMGDSQHFTLSDDSALRFAEAVYKELGKIPGDLIAEIVREDLVDLVDKVEDLREWIGERSGE